MALRPLFLFRHAQCVQVFPLKPAPFCALLAGFCSTNKSATFLLFFYYLTLVLSLPPYSLLQLSCYLKLCGRSGRNCLFSHPVLSGYNGSPNTRLSRGMTRLMSWPDGERNLHPLQSLVVSLLLSLVSTLVFSRTGGVLSHRSSLTHRLPQFLPRKLCALVMLAVRFLSSVKFFSLQDWQNRESFLQRLWTFVPGHLSSHSAMSSYGLFGPLTLCQHPVSLRPLVQTLESCSVSGAPWSPAIPPCLGRGRVTNNNNNNRTVDANAYIVDTAIYVAKFGNCVQFTFISLRCCRVFQTIDLEKILRIVYVCNLYLACMCSGKRCSQTLVSSFGI